MYISIYVIIPIFFIFLVVQIYLCILMKISIIVSIFQKIVLHVIRRKRCVHILLNEMVGKIILEFIDFSIPLFWGDSLHL